MTWKTRQCKFDGCTSLVHSAGGQWCAKHVQGWRQVKMSLSECQGCGWLTERGRILCQVCAGEVVQVAPSIYLPVAQAGELHG